MLLVKRLSNYNYLWHLQNFLIQIALLVVKSMIRRLFLAYIECIISTILIHVSLQGLPLIFGIVMHAIFPDFIHLMNINVQIMEYLFIRMDFANTEDPHPITDCYKGSIVFMYCQNLSHNALADTCPLLFMIGSSFRSRTMHPMIL